MALQHSHINVDGAVITIGQAMDGVNTGIAGANEAADYVRSAMAQPVGQALDESAGACDYLRKLLKSYLRRVNKVGGQAQDHLTGTLGQYVGRALDQTDQFQSLITSLGMVGPRFPPTVPPPLQPPGGPHLPPGGPAPPPPAGQPAPGLFYVYYQCGVHGIVGLTTYPELRIGVDPPGAPAPWQRASGPYADRQSAQAWVDANGAAFLASTCAVHGGRPPIPPLAPDDGAGRPVPAVPPGGIGANQIAAAQWCLYVDCAAYQATYDDNGNQIGGDVWPLRIVQQCAGDTIAMPGSQFLSHTWYRYPAYSGAPPAISIPEDSPAGRAAIIAWCKARAGGPPAPIPQPGPPQPGPQPGPGPGGPPGPPPPLPGPIQCQAPPEACIIDAGPVNPACPDGQIPDFLKIGSPEFCAQVQNMRDSFTKLGTQLISYVQSIDFSTPLNAKAGQIAVEGAGWIGELATNIFTVIASLAQTDAKGAIGVIRSFVGCWFKLVSSTTSCNITEVVALSVVKGLLEILQRLRTGWDLAVWGTIDVTIHISPLVTVLDYLIANACPAEIPSYSETVEAWKTGAIGDDQAMCLLSLRGHDWTVWYPVIYAGRERVEDHEYIQWARRNGMDDDAIRTNLRNYGYIDANDAAARLEIYDELPNVSDVLHFLQRNVFDADYVRDFGLMEGYEERFAPRYLPGLRALGMQEQTARDHYAAHWINPSIGQLAEMVQRLRPGRVDPAVQFTSADFLRVLAEQDIAPYFRERLRQISYRTLPIRQLTQLVISRQITEAELAERWQDIGYKPDDAKLLAKALTVQGNRQRATQQRQYTPAVVAKLWPARQITRQEAIDALSSQGLSPGDVDTLLEVSDRLWQVAQYEKHTLSSLKAYASLAVKAYGDGVVAQADAVQALVNAGFPQQAAEIEIGTESLRRRVQKIDDAKAAIKKAFLRGEVNADQASTALQLAGVLADAAADYVQRWSLLLTVPRKAATRGQILKWAKEGIISAANAEARLLNLGYSPDTIALDMVELALTIRQAEQRAASQRAADLAKADAAIRRARQQTQRAYCRLYTPGKMRLWYAERIIDESTFRERLAQCGYDAEQIELSFREAEVARAKRDEQAAKNGATGVEYTGPGADTSG